MERDLYDVAPEGVKRRSRSGVRKKGAGKEVGEVRLGGEVGDGGGEVEEASASQAQARTSTKRTRTNRTNSTATSIQPKTRQTHPRPSSPSSHHSDPDSDHSAHSPRLRPTPTFPTSHLPDFDSTSLDPADWADPRNLPAPMTMQGRQLRRSEEWRALELGGYRVALHDVATADLEDLGRTLVEWDGIARWRKGVEEETAARQEDVRRAAEEIEATEEFTIEDTPPPASSQPLTQPPPAQPQPATQPTPVPDPDAPEPERDDDDIPPIPTSTFLFQMSRWPVHPSALYGPPPVLRQRQKPFELSRFPRSEAEDAPPSLSESLTYLIQREARKLRRRLPPPPRSRAVASARSAYATDGPLFGAAASDASAQSDAGELSDEGNLSSHSLDSELDEGEAEVREEMEVRTGEVLQGMVGLVSKGNMPALDYWTKKARGDAGESSRRKKGVGWEGVLKVVKGMEGLPDG